MKKSAEWIKEEFSEAAFGDQRLTQRFQEIATYAALMPSMSINKAHQDWSSIKGAYRFFSNPKVTSENILKPHYLQTQKRASVCGKVIVVEDTSSLDFSRHQKTKGLGYHGMTSGGYILEGLELHATMAFSEQGLPLGLLDEKIWAQKVKHLEGHQKVMTPIEKKESFRWIKGLRQAAKTLPQSEMILVCDREADIYDLFEEALDLGVGAVVRSHYDRVLYDESMEDYIRMTDRLGIEPARGEAMVTLAGSGKRSPQEIPVEIRFCPVTFTSRPRGVQTSQISHRKDLELYLVEVREKYWSHKKSFLHWTLITTEPVKSLKAAQKIVYYYQLRWMIEVYFKTLKTGCGIEKSRLGRGERLIRYISLMSVIAWRILWMTYVQRISPNESCEVALSRPEWQALWLLHHHKKILSDEMSSKPPTKPPSLEEAIRWLAMVGGFIGRKGDGQPGILTIWRGWLSLIPATLMYEMMKKKNPHPVTDVGNR